MQRTALIEKVVRIILSTPCLHPLRVAIDGVDAAGKTTFVNEIVQGISSQTNRQVIQISVDEFHHPAAIRSMKGDLSAEGFYLDSYNYQALIKQVLIPFGLTGDRRYRSACHDLLSDQPVHPPLKSAQSDAILLMDGIFLLRPELLPFWDLTIFLDVKFEQSLERGITRDAKLFGSEDMARHRYKKRYIPGQKIYLKEARPLDKADILIDNSILECPQLLRIPMRSLISLEKN